MTIGQAAIAAGVNIQTLRYYERRGLLTEPPRGTSGYRVYSEAEVQVVRFIKRAQELGFSLQDIESLLGLASGQRRSCSAVRKVAESKVAELDRKIAMMRSMRRALQRLVDTCAMPRSEQECPLLEALEGHS
jgi:Hg(II)-responsive transcriptional regulator